MAKPRRRQKQERVVEQDGRQRAIERVRRKLLRGGRPRLLVSFLLALTGASGFLVSAALLRLGLTQMSVRYPLAVILAYCVFLLLLRLWLALQRRRGRGDGSDWLDFGDAVPNFFDAGGDAVRAATFGGGGDFGGGGAGGAWTGGDVSGGASVADISGGASVGNVSGGGVSGGSGSSLLDSMPSVDLDLDDGCFWIIIPVAAIAGVLFLMFYVVYVAPVFLAEILVDALLLAGLYKRLKGVEPRHWLRSCVRRTLLPALLAVALFIAAGYLMERVAPEARSIGEFWREISSPKPVR
ncbi:MAG: hypothetical protein QOD28_61 [Acidobacteriota bacterium]|nr:hypothetical protein [Acidobacteriota bacterium]